MSDNLHTYIEPELEARITALVLGEVSEFDVEELEQIIAEKPELEIFRRRMEAMHDLLGETVKPEKDEAWQLSDDRRAELRRTFSKKSAPVPAVSKIITHAQWRAGIGIAACLLVCLVIFSMMTPVGLKQSEMDQFTPEIVSYQAALDEEQEEEFSNAFRDKYGLPKQDKRLENGQRSSGFGAGKFKSKLEKNEQLSAEADRSVWRRSRKMAPGEERKPVAPSSSMAKVIASNTRSNIAIPTPEADVPAPSVAFAADDFDDSWEEGADFAGKSMLGNRPADLAMSDSEDDPFGGGLGDDIDSDRIYRREVSNGSDKLKLALKDESTIRMDGPNVNGDVSDIEVVREFKYPTEYEPPELPNSLAKAKPVKKDSFPVTPAESTVFETRSTGVVLETALNKEALGERKERSKSSKGVKSKDDAKSTAKPISAPQRPQPLPEETSTSAQPFSTFSLNVADVSFKLAKVALLEKGQWPEAAKVRTEEFINAFDYGDPSPRRGDPVACAIEQSAHPFLQQRNLLRIGMKTAALGRSTPLRLTVLLDNSGSMEREDREASVLAAMQVLASQLGPQDKITLIGFARQPRLLADRISGDQAGQLVNIVANTPSEGGTNLEEALRLARKLAKRQHAEGAQDRVVLITDGVANLGNTVPEQLSREIEIMRQKGIAFDACGVGAEDLNDKILEALTRKGDGRYYFLNRPEDADSGFAKQLAGALSPAAKNVKVQVVFNPKRVSKYRLLGFEKHRLNKEDFRNDKVDAAEMASEEAGNAVYQIEAMPDGEGELGEVFVRFLDANTGRMVERSWPLTYEHQAKSFDLAEPSMQLAATAAMLGEKLHGTDAGSVRFDMISSTLGKLRAHYAADRKVQDLIRMCEKVK